MFIQTQETPNPSTIKFLPGVRLIESGSFDFSSALETSKAPLAKRLFGITGVCRVFLTPDFISVSKGDDTDWSMLRPMVMAALMEHLSTGQTVLDQSYYEKKSESDSDDNEVVEQIKILIEERVRPMVMMDGGDIVFDRFEEGIVYLIMQGACSGCPSSTATLKVGIENMLRHYIPEVIEVRPSADF